jgi:hypothetical protein
MNDFRKYLQMLNLFGNLKLPLREYYLILWAPNEIKLAEI